MNDSFPTVRVPVPAYQCNIVVFPELSGYQQTSKFYVLNTHADIFGYQIGTLDIEYISGMVYCFLPSQEKRKGNVSVYTSKPSFVETFTFCFEVSTNITGLKKTSQKKNMGVL